MCNTLVEVGYVTLGENPGSSEPYSYTLNVCSNSSVACAGQTTDGAAVCQRNTENNQSFVLGQLSQQKLRYFSDRWSI